jgi:DNA-binding NarL/FixJ family response regulator
MSERVSNSGGYAVDHSSQNAGATAREHAHQPVRLAAWARLSPREREILALLAARWTDREIAETLYISYRTVTTHVSNIYDKLGIHSRREAAMVALAMPEVRPAPAWPQAVPAEPGA